MPGPKRSRRERTDEWTSIKHQINSQTDWRDGLEPPSEHHVSLLMVVRLASLVHGREAPHLSISRSMVGFTLVGMSLAACADLETEIR